MHITVEDNAETMASAAAEFIASKLNEAISTKGGARLLLSTGESQIAVLMRLREKDLPWGKVAAFHLDEYIGLPASHEASFRKYIRERFVEPLKPGAMHYVNGEGDVRANIASLTGEIRKAPIDLALVGIGENAHIAFNDPPADFDTREAYIVVTLDEACKKQQVGEGWFESVDEVPKQAVSITVYQMMLAKTIVSVVPGVRKAAAVRDTLSSPVVTNGIPATKLREHRDWRLFLDAGSASLTGREFLRSVLRAQGREQ